MHATTTEYLSRPAWQRMRIEQMAHALGVPAIVLGLPAPTEIELAQDRFLCRCEQLCQLWRVAPRRFDRKIEDRKMRVLT